MKYLTILFLLIASPVFASQAGVVIKDMNGAVVDNGTIEVISCHCAPPICSVTIGVIESKKSYEGCMKNGYFEFVGTQAINKPQWVDNCTK